MKITVRTLDSNNHNFEFDDENITVKEFKELIFPDVNIPVDKQRIIFKGKILQDDKKIKEYGVDGCVVHLVQRAPPSTSASQESSTTAATPPTSSSSAPGPVPLNNSFGGSFPVAQQFVDNLISQFGAENVSMNASGNSLNVNINVSPSNSTEDVRRRLQVARRFLCHADHLLRHMQPNHSHGGNCSHTQNAKESNHRAEREHSGDTSGVHQSESNSNQPTIDNDKSSSASNGVNPMDEIRNDNNVSMEDVVPNENNNLNTPPSQSNATQDQNIVRPQVLSHFLGDFMHFFHHFAPLLQRYRFLLHNPQGPERQATDDLLPDQMAEIFHDLSHAFHAISDLTFNFNSPTPQSLSCFPQMSPIRFQQATPHMRMMPVPRNSVGNSALRQGGPVAVAAISTTVVHIPASSVQRFVSGGETLTTPSATQGPINQNFPSSDQWHISGPAGVPIGGLPSGGNTGIPAGVMFGPFSMNIPQPTSVITGTAPNVSNTPRPRGGNASDVNMQDVLQNVMSALFPPVLNSTASGNPQSSSIQGHVNETSTPSATNDNSQRIHQRPQTSAQNLSQEISNQPHHHNQDSAVLHHDLLLPCHSFHLGPNFHSSNNNPQTTPQVVEVASVVIDHTSNLAAPTVNQTSSGQQTTVVPDTNSATTGGADMSSISNILNSMFGSLSSTNNPFSENDSSSFEDETSMDVEMDRDVSHQLMDLVTVLNENSNGAESSTRNPTLRSIFETRFQRPQNEEGANFFTELYDIFGETFTIPDLVAIMSGSTTPWARIQAPLRKLLEKHFNSNERITEAEIPNIAKKMAESLAGNDCMEITVRPDVDLAATLKNLEVDYFKKFLRLLISAESDYCNGIHSWFVEYAAWFFAVLDYSVTGGTESYITAYLSTESMEDALSEFSPAIRQFSTETLIRRTRASISGQAISPVALDAVIIRPGVKTMIQRENPCREGDSGRAAKRVRKNESVDVEKIWEEMNDGSTPSSESDPEVDSPPSPEDWHSQFPNDWVNVITRDVERQRKLPPQRPYSDAYLNGLSSKRRALMTRHGVEADRIDLKTSLKKAIEKVGVETDLKKLDDDIESTNLQGMFESAFKSDVRQRLQSDEDYRSKQHPNTEKYFIKKGKK